MPSVFISYQTRTHRRYLPTVVAALNDAGLKHWLDADNVVPASRVEGLEMGLLSGLRKADAILVFTPAPGRKLRFDQRIRELLDNFASALTAEGYGSSPFATYYLLYLSYRFLYGINVMYRHGESWQAWEERVGRAIGLEVVCVTVVDELVPSSNNHGSFVFAANELAEGLRSAVLPRLIAAEPRQRPELTPRARAAIAFLKQVGLGLKWALVIAAVLVCVVLALAIAIGLTVFGAKFAVALVVAGGVACGFYLRTSKRPR